MENERVQMKMTVEVVMSAGKEVFESDEEFDALDALIDKSITVDSINLDEMIIIGLDGEEYVMEIDNEEFKESMMGLLKEFNERA